MAETKGPVGLTKDVGWEIGVSRTVAASPDRVWSVLLSDEGLTTWLGSDVSIDGGPGTTYRTSTGTTGEVRSYKPGDRVRLTWRPADWGHDATVQVATSQSPGGTIVRFHTERLADADEREAMRAHWKAVMDDLVAILT